MGGELIGIGAEAVLTLGELYGFKVVRKARLPKPYRDPKLDEALRRERTATEAKIMIEAKSLGIPCPTVLDVDLEEAVIVMDYVEGPRLSRVLTELPRDELTRIFVELGKYAGLLHAHGIVHGDLTTSNVILHWGRPYLIDFGLSQYSRQLEDRGVDVHLFLRALESTHFSLSKFLFERFMEGYASVVGEDEAKRVLEKVREIRRRGRYVSERRLKGALRHGE